MSKDRNRKGGKAGKWAFILLAFGLLLPSDAQIFVLRRKANVSAQVTPCSSVYDANLKAYWKFDEASGNAVDSKGANTLTDNNTVGTAAGKINSARDFNAASSEDFSIADNNDLSTGDIDCTGWCWWKYDAVLGAGQFPGIIGKWQAGQLEYQAYLNGDNQRVQFTVSNDGTATTEVRADNFGDPSEGAWHFMVFWHDSVANTINIQIDNGTVDSTPYSAGIFDGTSTFTIGSAGTGNYWTGQIDEVGFTKRVLTVDERDALYGSTLGCRPSPL